MGYDVVMMVVFNLFLGNLVGINWVVLKCLLGNKVVGILVFSSVYF